MTDPTPEERAEELALKGWMTLGKTEPELIAMLTDAICAAESRGFKAGMLRAAEIADSYQKFATTSSMPTRIGNAIRAEAEGK